MQPFKGNSVERAQSSVLNLAQLVLNLGSPNPAVIASLKDVQALPRGLSFKHGFGS